MGNVLGQQNKEGQSGDGLVVGGASYAIASDWGTAGGTGFTLTHVQIVKMGWGDSFNTYRTSKDQPLPVQFYSANSSGTTGALVDDNFGLKVTGDVRINSTLEIAGGKIDGNKKPVVGGIIQLVGATFGKSGPTAYGPGHTRDYHFNPIKVTGAIQGFTAAYPIGITYGGGQPGKGPGEGLIRRIYGGPIGYTGYTGINLQTKPGAGQNSSILDRDIDYIAIQGLSGAFGVGVTASRPEGLLIRRLSFPYNNTGAGEHAATPDGDRVGIVGIKGATAVEVTGGVRIVHSPAGGSMEIRNLSSGRDNVAVWGADGGTAAHVKLFHSDGTPIGISGSALKVAIDNGTFTGNVTLSTNVYVRNATGGVLKVQGSTGAEIVVKGPLSGGALEVASPSGLNIRNLTSADTVGLAGGAAEDLGQIQSDVSIGTGRLGNIQTNSENLINKVTSLNSDVNKMVVDGTEESNVDSEEIAFNTHIHRVYQPDVLISLSKVIGSNATQLNNNTVIYNGVYVSADSGNTEDILVGNTALKQNSRGGYQLAAGESVFLQVSNLNRIYVRSVGGNQTVRCIGS
jgi:hypothetical protein